MDSPLRVVHYLNQFFAGIGGEEQANLGVSLSPDVLGAGRALEQALGETGQIIGTMVCGDNHANDQREEALAAMEAHLRALHPDVVIAGPAFGSGRYGLACAEVCKLAQSLDIAAVTGMHPDNPGVVDSLTEIYIVPTGETTAEMPTALRAMTRLAASLARAHELGPAEVEGYLPRGRISSARHPARVRPRPAGVSKSDRDAVR